MAELDLRMYHRIDQDTKDLINGYIRGHQNQTKPNGSPTNIPVSIGYICALFYFIFIDAWHKDRHALKYMISGDDNTTITSTKDDEDDDDEESSACLTTTAIKGKHHWKFKITKWPKAIYAYIILGIVKDNQDFNKIAGTFLGHHANATYCWDLQQMELNIHGNEGISEWKGGYGTSPVQGDTVDMYLDLDALVLSFGVNGTHFGKAFDVDAGYGYVGAVSFRDPGTEMILLEYNFDGPEDAKYVHSD